MATKQVSVRLAATGGKQVKAELVEIGAAGERSFSRLNLSAQGSAGGLQNLGFQVQDFAVQVAGGTAASQALAQQLPQLLSGFGLMGIALGTASAVLIPLAGYLFDAGDSAAEAATKIGDLEAAVKELKAANENFDLSSLDELIAKYGELDAAIVLMLTRQQEAKEVAVIDKAKAAVAGIAPEIDKVRAALQAYDNLVKLSLENPAYGADALLWAEALQEEFGVTTFQARELVAAVDSLRGAQGLQDAATAAADLYGRISDTTLASSELNDALLDVESLAREAANAMADMPGLLGAAIGAASDLAGQLWEAARAAFSVTQNQAAAAAAPAVGGDRLAQAYAQYGATRSAADSPVWAAPVAPAAAPRRGGGGRRRAGGGGGGGGMSEDMREAARIYDETRTAAEKYATELERLNELKAGGFLADDTYARAMENLRDKTDETADAMKELESSVGSAFVSFVTGAKSGREALQDLLSSMAEALANQAFQAIAGSIFGGGGGGGGGGLFAGIFGGGRAGGGPVRAGWSYRVGENGPELITMGGNGYVTNTAALRSAVQGGGGGVVIQIDARGAVEGVAAQVRREVEGVIPAIVQASVAASRSAAARGR